MILLLAGVAAAQPPAPPAPDAPVPRALPATPAPPPAAPAIAGDQDDPPRPARAPRPPRPAIAEDWAEAPQTPAPARAPFVAIVGDEFDAPQPPTPPPSPRALAEPAQAPMPPEPPQAVPAPAAVPMPPMPPQAFEFDRDKLFQAQEKLFELRDKFDYDFDYKFDFEMDKQMAQVDKSLAKLKMDFPNFAPQAMVAGKMRNMPDDRAYEAGQRALEGHRYSEALEYFNQVASRAGNRADGALYWKAYALIRLGRQDEARGAIADLRKSYASSRWLDDAKALEVEAGKPVTPESESDEELKLIALNGLMQSDPDRALPLLDSLLKSAQPPKIKRQAIFVLAQSNSPKGQQLLEQVARGQGNPDLQLAAIRYLGERRRQGGSNPILAEIYASSNDVNVKRAILNAFESARDKDRLLQIAKTEKQQDLRLQAIRLLGSIQGTQADLWALYQAETTPEGKQQILESMPSAGNLDKMLEVARTERDPKVRRFAIQTLSTPRASNTGDSLATIYSSEQDEAVKRAILDALSGQRNVKAMIQIARAEKDNRMQQRILEHLVGMHSPEASDYLMEIIKK
jgi:hypothetical protein